MAVLFTLARIGSRMRALLGRCRAPCIDRHQMKQPYHSFMIYLPGGDSIWFDLIWFDLFERE
jgi:hypothetical protein